MNMKWFKQSILALFCISVLFSCDYDYIEIASPEPPPPPCDTCEVDTIHFATQIEPIFTTTGCTDCHTVGYFLDLTVGNSYASIMANGSAIAGDPENSLLYTLPHPVTGTHYKKYTSNEDSDLIYGWIYQGALNN